MSQPAELPASMRIYYFRVADVDQAVSQTTARGGRITHGPIEIPGGEFAVNAVDPQGAMFAFVGPRKVA
jgi:hypothetical protein